jgi:hypothetical protein
VSNALAAGVVYFAFAFGAGFALGVARVLVVQPSLGATAAVAIELPIILALSWLGCRRIVTKFAVGQTIAARSMMGATALTLLLAAELLLGLLGISQKPVANIDRYSLMPELMGLAAQLVFATFPSLQLALVRQKAGSGQIGGAMPLASESRRCRRSPAGSRNEASQRP